MFSINKSELGCFFQGALNRQVPLYILGGSTYIKNNMLYSANSNLRRAWNIATDQDLFYKPTVSRFLQILADSVTNTHHALWSINTRSLNLYLTPCSKKLWIRELQY